MTTEYARIPRPAAHTLLALDDACNLRRPREDALPEHTAYHDDGCDLFASCLACPLPRCRYDEPGGARVMLNRVRDREIRELRIGVGLSVDEIAARFRVSRRTVFRALEDTPPARHRIATTTSTDGRECM